MIRYVLQRLLGMIPTLGLVLLALFGLINAIPAVASAPADPRADAEQARAGLSAFREQFGLDQPVFLNLRYRTRESDVLALLRAAHDLADPERAIRARAQLSDLGRFALPALIACGSRGDLPEALLDDALARASAAVERLTPAAERSRIRDLRPFPPLSAGDRARLAEAQRAWLEANAEQFRFSAAECLRIALFETRFATYIERLARLDFGLAMADRQPVLPTLLLRAERTVLMALLAVLIAYGAAIPLGILLVLWRGTARGRALALALDVGYSLPVFFVGALLLRFLTVGEPVAWFPIGGLHRATGFEELGAIERWLDRLHHLVLPVFCLSYAGAAVLARYLRDGLLEALGSDYLRTARAKGAGEGRLLLRHALKNALLPIATLLGEALPFVFGGSAVVEFLFDVPGMGSYLFDAVLANDYNVVLAVCGIAAILTLLGYLLSDLLYAAVDPRIRLARGAG